MASPVKKLYKLQSHCSFILKEQRTLLWPRKIRRKMKENLSNVHFMIHTCSKKIRRSKFLVKVLYTDVTSILLNKWFFMNNAHSDLDRSNIQILDRLYVISMLQPAFTSTCGVYWTVIGRYTLKPQGSVGSRLQIHFKRI